MHSLRSPLFILVDGGRLRGSCVSAVPDRRTSKPCRQAVRPVPAWLEVGCHTTEERHSSTLLWQGGARWCLPGFKTSFARPSMMMMMTVYFEGVPPLTLTILRPHQTIAIPIEPYFSTGVISTYCCLQCTPHRLTCFRNQKVYFPAAMH